MKEVYYIYNNEAIASCILLSVLQEMKSIDIPCSCLILPFLMDDQTVTYLSRIQPSEIDLVQLINDRPRLFTSFNKRYLALLPIAINSLILLRKSNQIVIETNISINGNIHISSDIDLGERYQKILRVLPSFTKIIEKYSTLELYKILNIQL